MLLKKEKGKVKYEDVNQSLSKYNHKDKELRLPHQSNLLHAHDRWEGQFESVLFSDFPFIYHLRRHTTNSGPAYWCSDTSPRVYGSSQFI